jgi:hypothetical protein
VTHISWCIPFFQLRWHFTTFYNNDYIPLCHVLYTLYYLNHLLCNTEFIFYCSYTINKIGTATNTTLPIYATRLHSVS